MSYITLQFSFHKDITWESHLIFDNSLTITHSSMLLNRYQYLRNISCE